MGKTSRYRTPALCSASLLDGIPRRRRVSIVPLALIFDGEDRPAAAVDDENIRALAVDRMERVAIGRLQNFAKTCLRENAMTFADGGHLVLDDLENAIFGSTEDPLLVKRRSLNRVELAGRVCKIEVRFPGTPAERVAGVETTAVRQPPALSRGNSRKENKEHKEDHAKNDRRSPYAVQGMKPQHRLPPIARDEAIARQPIFGLLRLPVGTGERFNFAGNEAFTLAAGAKASTRLGARGRASRRVRPGVVSDAGICYFVYMTKLLRDTIKQVEQLPEDEQDAAAVAMLDYLAHRRDLRVSDKDLAEIRRRRADPNRKLVSHEDARERIQRLGRR